MPDPDVARTYRIVALPGDGIGPEVTAAALAVLDDASAAAGFTLEVESLPVGGASLDAHGEPLTDAVLDRCRAADAVFLGAVGGPAWDDLPSEIRPERGLLKLRKGMGVFANLRPAVVDAALAGRSPLRPERVQGTDLLVVRELTGGIYFGEPAGREDDEAWNTMRYTRAEIERIAHVAFAYARNRRGHVTSVDKANVLAVSRLWRDVVSAIQQADYPDVTLEHMYVDNAAMQLVLDPAQFDVILTGNLFGDILSDIAATLVGSLGLLPSASVGGTAGLFEPVHGSAPDLAGRGVANPVAAILSGAMLLDHLGEDVVADAVRAGVREALATETLTADLAPRGARAASTREVLELIRHRARPHLSGEAAAVVP